MKLIRSNSRNGLVFTFGRINLGNVIMKGMGYCFTTVENVRLCVDCMRRFMNVNQEIGFRYQAYWTKT